MQAPKDVWINLYPAGDIYVHLDEASAAVGLGPVSGGQTHRYRLVKPSRPAIAYVVKTGIGYVYGARTVASLTLADRWAVKAEAADVARNVNGRVVKLVRKS